MSENKTDYGRKQQQPVSLQYKQSPKGPRQTRHYEEYKQAEKQRQIQAEQQRQQMERKNQMLAKQRQIQVLQQVERKNQIQQKQQQIQQQVERRNQIQQKQQQIQQQMERRNQMQQKQQQIQQQMERRNQMQQKQQQIQQQMERRNQMQSKQPQIQSQQPQDVQKQKKQNQAKRQMELRKKRRKKEILMCVLFVALLAITFGIAKLYTVWKGFEVKAEQSDFVATAAQPQEITDDVLNVAVFGTDKDGFRADVNMLVNFNVTEGKVHIISVPRDTRVVMTDDMIAYLKENHRYIPGKNGVYGQCKLTELHAYAGEGNRSAFSVAMLEELLGVDIDYYVKVDLDAFQEIVDAVGGVTFYVEDRLYYSDPEQGLYIDLYPGEQLLDGKKAEMLVRFREDYAQKDLKRVQVQQAFIKAFVAKVFQDGNVTNNLNHLIQIGLEKTETDMPIAVALQYVPYVAKINPNEITTDTIPGDGGGYFEMDEEGTKELVDYRIYGKEMPSYMQETDDMTQNDTTTNG